MTRTKKPNAAGRRSPRKLKLKKQTLKDLDMKRGAKKVRGGAAMVEYVAKPNTYQATCGCTVTCLYTCYCQK